jgi:hypothetical protein
MLLESSGPGKIAHYAELFRRFFQTEGMDDHEPKGLHLGLRFVAYPKDSVEIGNPGCLWRARGGSGTLANPEDSEAVFFAAFHRGT